MGLLEMASNNSYWRGYDYYQLGKVNSLSHIDEGIYEGTVQGRADEPYDVYLDIEHPKKSTCTCPHAEGTRRVCKHKVAVYLTIFPEEGERILKEAEEWEAEEEERLAEERLEIEKYVHSLSKQELREELLWRLLDEMDRGYW